MWMLIIIFAGTLIAIFFATVPSFKEQAMRPSVQLLLGLVILTVNLLWVTVMGYFLPTVFLNTTEMFALPLAGMFWFGIFALRAALRKPRGKKINSLKEDFSIFLMAGPIVFIVVALLHPALVIRSLSGISAETRSLMGAALALSLAIGLFVLRLNCLRIYASLEIAIGLGASYVTVRGFTPSAPIGLAHITALAGALYVIVRGLDNYRKGRLEASQTPTLCV
jgi:hypothetical protein